MDIAIVEKVIDSQDLNIGGGTASAIAGSMAAGMLAMVARISLCKPVQLSEAELQAIIAEADTLAAELLAGANQDADAYLGIKAAYKLPKDTDEQKAVRARAISDAATHAAEVPRDNARRCQRVHELALRMVGTTNPNCSSDVMSAKFLAFAGAKGCTLNIAANLGLIKDEASVAALQGEIDKLQIFF